MNKNEIEKKTLKLSFCFIKSGICGIWTHDRMFSQFSRGKINDFNALSTRPRCLNVWSTFPLNSENWRWQPAFGDVFDLTLCTVGYKYQLFRLILTISYMRQYEFKTINPGQPVRSPVNIPKNIMSFAQSPKINFQQASDQSFSFMPAPIIKNNPKAEEPIKTNPSNISSGGSQPEQNLSLMRKQLDLLMKQT